MNPVTYALFDGLRMPGSPFSEFRAGAPLVWRPTRRIIG